jgi:hypothetical protein
MKAVKVLAFTLLSTVTSVTGAGENDPGPGPVAGPADMTFVPHGDIALFDLHDPGLMDSWTALLATTPMLNGVPLPPRLQDRLASAVATYRFLTPNGQPSFFVATYFDLLSERLLNGSTPEGDEILPMRVCPVFRSGSDASVSKLLALASGLPEELFAHAAGQPERYRFLFLQTELSHCNFLAKTMATYPSPQSVQVAQHDATSFTKVSFDAGQFSFTATLRTEKELRALLETVGDADAIAAFRKEFAGASTVDEAEVLSFVRLLSLLATDGRSGYAAIPVLLPLIFDQDVDEYVASTETLRISDALTLAYRARASFGRIAPFAIRAPQDLMRARSAVMQALAEGKDTDLTDQRVRTLFDRFVTGAEFLLASTSEDEKVPLIVD